MDTWFFTEQSYHPAWKKYSGDLRVDIPGKYADPVDLMDRYWEAHDLILEAMTNQNEQFSWEGKHFNYRAVNLWPRPIQQPHPPVWVSSNSPGSGKWVAEKGYNLMSFLTGYAG